MQMIRKLEWYQKDAFDFSIQFTGSALYMVQGTGKTTVAIAIACYREAKRIIIVCPPNVMDTWEVEIRASVNGKISFHYMIGGQKASMPKPCKGVQIIIVSYTSVYLWRKELQKWKPEFVIADESQMIKKHTSLQSKALHRLESAPFKLLLSGTPIDESGLDVFSQYKFACPEIFGSKWKDFRKYYARNDGYGYTNWVIRKKREPELIAKIRSRMYRVDRDVLKLKKPIFYKVKFDLEKKTKKWYNNLVDNSVVSINGHEIVCLIALTKVGKLAQISTGWVKDDEEEWVKTSIAKQLRFQKLLNKLYREEDKVVVFTRYTKEVLAIKAVASEMQIKAFTLTGKTDKSVRKRRRERFRDYKSKAIFITQIRSGGVGINELRIARDGIFYSLGHSWIDYDQALSRLLRRGQDKQVRLWHMMGRGTVEEDIYRTVREKGTSADVVLNIRRIQ